jgi:hypothetical protein
MLSFIYAECHIQALYAECHYGECRCAECHGALKCARSFEQKGDNKQCQILIQSELKL